MGSITVMRAREGSRICGGRERDGEYEGTGVWMEEGIRMGKVDNQKEIRGRMMCRAGSGRARLECGFGGCRSSCVA